LLPLCFYAPKTCLSPYPIFPISPMTGHATRFHPPNRATEHSPVRCGQECPRSCTRWKKQRPSGARPSSAASTRRPTLCPVSITQIRRPNIHRLGAAKNRRAPARGGKSNGPRERGRPRPHQRNDRLCDPFGSRKCAARKFTGWVRARMPALLHAVEKATAVGSAAVPGHINVTTDLMPRFDHANAAPEHTPVGCGQECPRSCTRWKKQRPSGARPSSAAPTGRPILRPVSIHQPGILTA